MLPSSVAVMVHTFQETSLSPMVEHSRRSRYGQDMSRFCQLPNITADLCNVVAYAPRAVLHHQFVFLQNRCHEFNRDA